MNDGSAYLLLGFGLGLVFMASLLVAPSRAVPGLMAVPVVGLVIGLASIGAGVLLWP